MASSTRSGEPSEQLTFADVPARIQQAYGFLDRVAVYHVAVVEQQLASGAVMEMVLFVTADGLFTGTLDGSLCRCLPLTRLRGIGTNANASSKRALGGVGQDFVAFLAQKDDPDDLVIIGPESLRCASEVSRVLKRQRIQVGVRKDAIENFTKVGYMLRLPQSVYSGDPPPISSLPPRHVDQRSGTSQRSQSPPPPAHHGSTPSAVSRELQRRALPVEARSDVSAPFAAAAATATSTSRSEAAAPVLGNKSETAESGAYREMCSLEHIAEAAKDDTYVKFDMELNLAFADFPLLEPVVSRFPTLSLGSKEIYFVVAVSHLENSLQRGQELVPRILYLSRSHLYVAERENHVLRCCPLADIDTIFALSDPHDLPVVRPPEVTNFILVTFVDSLAHPDVLLGFVSTINAAQFGSIADKVLAGGKKGWPTRFRAVANLNEAGRDIIRIPTNYQSPNVAPIRDRPRLEVFYDTLAAKAVRVAPWSQATSKEGPPAPKGEAAATGGLSAAAAARVHSLPQLAQVALQMDQSEGVEAVHRGASHAEEDVEVYIPYDVRAGFAMFRDVVLEWASAVMYYVSTTDPPVEAYLYLTPTQLVVARGGISIRVLPLVDIVGVYVMTIDGLSKRRFTAFAARNGAKDLCVETVGKASDTLLKKAHRCIRKLNPTDVPAICTITSIRGRPWNLPGSADGGPQQQIDIPPTSDSVRYRNYTFTRVYEILKMFDPPSARNTNRLMEEYMGRELELLSTLYNAYPGSSQYIAAREQRQHGLLDPSKATEGLGNYHERLTRFCEAYMPESIDVVHDVLEKYKGREEKLLAALTLRHGPEPQLPLEQAGSRALVVGAAVDPDVTRTRLVRFYRVFEPKRLADIEHIMEMYRGREELLFRKLVHLYGPEPPASAELPQLPKDDDDDPNGQLAALTYSQRLSSFFKRYVPMPEEDLPEKVMKVLQSYAGHEEALIRSLVSKYGPEPLPCTPRNRGRVAAFLVRAGLPKPILEEIDDIISSYPGNEASFFDHMARRYGAENPLQFVTSPAPVSITDEMYAKVDVSLDLPYVCVPQALQPLFPSMGYRAALLWFGRVMLWEPPTVPQLCCLYLTSSHLYVAQNEASVRRCIPLARVQHVYLNSLRDDGDAQCAALAKVAGEFDCFLTYASDEEAKEFVSVLLAVLVKYHFASSAQVSACVRFSNPSIGLNCTRPSTFVCHVAPVSVRPRESMPTSPEQESIEWHQRRCKLLSDLHDAVVLRQQDDAACAEEETKAALLQLRPSVAIKELMLRETKVFGSVPLVGTQQEVTVDSIPYIASPAAAPRALTYSGAKSSHPGSPQEVSRFGTADEAMANSESLRQLDPFRRHQFMKHTATGVFGRSGTEMLVVPGRSGQQATLAASDSRGMIGDRRFVPSIARDLSSTPLQQSSRLSA